MGTMGFKQNKYAVVICMGANAKGAIARDYVYLPIYPQYDLQDGLIDRIANCKI